MRQIKFRAWDGEYMDYFDNLYWFEESGVTSVVDGRGIGGHYNYHIMQFTGLHDANGVEVYEGDVVEVERVDGCFGRSNYIERDIVSYPTYEELEAISTGGPDGCDSVVRIAVIGNIHQNPELLDTESD